MAGRIRRSPEKWIGRFGRVVRSARIRPDGPEVTLLDLATRCEESTKGLKGRF